MISGTFNTLQRIWNLVGVATKNLEENGVSTKIDHHKELYRARNSQLSMVHELYFVKIMDQ
jgi:hypothetical protein